jgi:hypothetical protein
MRRLSLLVAVVTVVVSCGTGVRGPLRPVDPSKLSGTDAVEASASRFAAKAFLDAYALAPQDEGQSLNRLVGSSLLRRWVFWLSVQNQEFPGDVTGRSLARVGTSSTVDLSEEVSSEVRVQEVQVDGPVSFRYEPEVGEAFSVERDLTGPMRLLETGPRHWQVVDFSRDGVPMSLAYQVVGSSFESEDTHLLVSFDSFFAVPQWQFCLIARIRGSDETVSLAPHDAMLLDSSGTVVADASIVTRSLRRIRKGRAVPGLVSFPARSTTQGMRLELTFRSSTNVRVLEIDLGELKAVSVAPESPAG